MKGCHQWSGSSPNEGRRFEEFMLGEKSRFQQYPKTYFLDAFIRSLQTQPIGLGFPNDPQPNIKYVLQDIRELFPDDERGLVRVFSTINRPLEKFGTDCLFYYRGKFVQVDLTLQNKQKRFRHQLIFKDDYLGSSEKMRQFIETAAHLLKIPDSYNTLPLSFFIRVESYVRKGYR